MPQPVEETPLVFVETPQQLREMLDELCSGQIRCFPFCVVVAAFAVSNSDCGPVAYPTDCNAFFLC